MGAFLIPTGFWYILKSGSVEAARAELLPVVISTSVH